MKMLRSGRLSVPTYCAPVGSGDPVTTHEPQRPFVEASSPDILKYVTGMRRAPSVAMASAPDLGVPIVLAVPPASEPNGAAPADLDTCAMVHLRD